MSQTAVRVGLGRMLDPERIAVVGASDAPGNRGGAAMRYLRRFGFSGEVIAVHPSGAGVAGYPGVASIGELPEGIDTALVGLAAARVPQAVSELAEAGVGSAVVWAGGFSETGVAGAKLQADLAVAGTGIRVVGPNCLGVVNTERGYCGTFATWLDGVDSLLPGTISMVTQSGGLGSAAHAMAQRAGVGFRYFASTGNEVDVDALELLEAFIEDPDTRVVAAYLEGISDGRPLIRHLHRARELEKSVVLLKGGRSSASARAAAAHTGALAGAGRVWDDLVAEAGAVSARSLDELVDLSVVLSTRSVGRSSGRRVAVVGFGGGSGVLAADLCSDAGLEVPALSPSLQKQLAPLAPPFASVANPLDLTPEAANRDELRAHLPKLLRTLAESGEIDALMLQGGAMTRGLTDVATFLTDAAQSGSLPATVYWPDPADPVVEIFRVAGIRLFEQQTRAAATLSQLLNSGGRESRNDPSDSDSEPRAVQPDLSIAVGRSVCGEHLVHELLRSVGVPTLPGRLATTAAEASEIAAELRAGGAGGLALKVVSETVTHRAAAGLVRLRVDDAGAMFTELMAAARRIDPEPVGVYVQAMAQPSQEYLVSALRDPVFGTVISVAAGGILTELIDDVTFGLAPLTKIEALTVLGRLKTARFREGHGAAGELERLADFVAAFSGLAASLPWASYVLEINPVMVGATEAVAADGLLLIERETE